MAWEPQQQLCVLEWFLANGVGAAAANLESNGNASAASAVGFQAFYLLGDAPVASVGGALYLMGGAPAAAAVGYGSF